MFDRIYQQSHLVLYFFFGGGGLLITDSMCSLVIGLFRLSIFYDLVLVGCIFLGVYPFLIGYLICGT